MKRFLFAIGCLFVLSGQSLAYELNLFVGANVGVTGLVMGDDLRSTEKDGIWDVQSSYFGMGADFGVRFLTYNVYNAGITAAYDYMFDAKTEINSNYKPYISYSKIGFSTISAVFDNYIRIDGRYENRQDIVIGLGVANITERLYIAPTSLGVTAGGLRPVDEKDDGLAAVFKLAYNVKIGNHEGYISARYFYAAEKDVEGLFNMNIGIRYIF